MDCNSQLKIFQLQQGTQTNKTDSTESSDKKPLKINLASSESDNMTDDIFCMNESVETKI